MKKIMIAAAVAAMIGSASASYTYDFSASLKTTKGSNSGATTYKVNLGANAASRAAGTWWYDAPQIDKSTGDITWEVVSTNATTLAEEVTTNVLKGVVVPHKTYGYTLKFGKDVSDALKESLAKEVFGFDGLDTNYNIKDIKNRWCTTFSYKVSGCYRVAGSVKMTGKLEIDNCCDDADFDAYNFMVGSTPIDPVTLNIGFLYRFGGITWDKAKKVEFTGVLGDVTFDGTAVDTFALAGQGTWSDSLKDVDNDVDSGISTASGNIVGVLVSPSCYFCCGPAPVAIAFECDTYLYEEVSDKTAAFGTFTMKFNKRDSDF